MVSDANLAAVRAIADSQDGEKSRIQTLRLFNDLFGMDPESTISRKELDATLSSAFLVSEHVSELCYGGRI